MYGQQLSLTLSLRFYFSKPINGLLLKNYIKYCWYCEQKCLILCLNKQQACRLVHYVHHAGQSSNNICIAPLMCWQKYSTNRYFTEQRRCQFSTLYDSNPVSAAVCRLLTPDPNLATVSTCSCVLSVCVCVYPVGRCVCVCRGFFNPRVSASAFSSKCVFRVPSYSPWCLFGTYPPPPSPLPLFPSPS